MRKLLFVLLAACGGGGSEGNIHKADAPYADASLDDVLVNNDLPAPPPDTAPAYFGELSGMCGVLKVADFTGATPEFFRDKFTFATEYVDATDRSMLTDGGQRMMATPNAGGSSGLSEAFAYEELARCESATLLHTETEITYSTTGKITDLEVEMQGHKIGVSVTRAVAFPFGSTYTLDAATTLIKRKLTDIQTSSADVSPMDKWDKQILAVLAWDDATADTVNQAWTALDAATKADTLVVVTVTDGADMFIYNNQ